MGDGSASATSRTTASSAAVSPTSEFTDFVKSTYRVLLTRGLRGCYVYFMDAPTRDFVLSRIEKRAFLRSRAAEDRGHTRCLDDRVGGHAISLSHTTSPRCFFMNWSAGASDDRRRGTSSGSSMRSFAVSLLTEEGTRIRLQATWIDPSRPDPSPPIRIRRHRWKWVPFAHPIPADARSFAKVAMATDPRSSWLGVYSTGGELAVHRFVDLQTVTDEFANQESNSAFPPPGLFQLRVGGIGHLELMMGHVTVGELRAGVLTGPSIDVFASGVIGEKYVWVAIAMSARSRRGSPDNID